jgi:methionyl-tRNA formyltransferase
MKFAFVTCVQLGYSCIEKIYETGGHIDLLITLFDHKAKNKSGRIYLDKFAGEHHIPLLKINHVNDDEVKSALKQYEIDYMFIIGWSQIADGELIQIPKYGTFGIHPTLLPEGRGRAAIPWAILKGLERTGVTLFKLDAGVDTGHIVDQLVIPIDLNETATTLYEKVSKAHEILIVKVYRDMQSGEIQLQEQDTSKATVWEGRTPADGEIFPNMSVEEADRLIRATTHPYPGAFIRTKEGKKIIWSAKISNGKEAGNPLILANGVLDIIEFEWESSITFCVDTGK